MGMMVFLVLLVIWLPTHCQSKHLLRMLTFCQNVTADSEYDVEFDGDELLYVDPVVYNPVQRLQEFAEQWTPNPGLPADAYLAIGTCLYNVPRATKGEKNPPQAIVPPTSQVYLKQEMELGVANTIICLVSDFHPTPVVITWARNEQPVDQSNVSQTQYYSNKDFSFRIFSYLSFTPQDGDIYSCSVGHISLQEPLTKFLDIGLHTDHQTAEITLYACCVTVGLMGVATGVWLIMKANKLT